MTAPGTPFAYSPLPARPPIAWPGGARIAFYLGVNIEHYRLDRASTSIFPGTVDLVPDALNYGWRDYGPRVGIWRILEILDRYEIPATALINSEVCSHYPGIIQAGLERDWAWVAHGRDNSTLQASMSRDTERAYLAELTATISQATGTHPRGWMGPALTETFHTPSLLAELGFDYTLDWTNDDQPYALTVPGMISVPYAIEVNDVTLCVQKSYTGPEFAQAIIDQFDQLYADSATSGRVMALGIHPFSSGQPFRAKYLDQALAHITGHDGVWVTTSDQIATAYHAQQPARPGPEQHAI